MHLDFKQYFYKIFNVCKKTGVYVGMHVVGLENLVYLKVVILFKSHFHEESIMYRRMCKNYLRKFARQMLIQLANAIES